MPDTNASATPSDPEAAPPAPPTFDVIPLSADVRKAIDLMGYKSPTPVQRAVYEPAARGKNLVVQARTGTGKTAAFGLPIIDVLIRRSVANVQALILCPTRELALQVSKELEQLAQFRGTKVTAIYGGAPMGKQVEALSGGAQIVVGTPGRVLDHMRRKTLDPQHIRIFVLDEADEMLSMGFAKELHAIVEMLPKERQGLLFSATIPPSIERLAANQLKDAEFVTLSSDSVGALQIAHFVYLMRHGDKRQNLIRIIEVENPESAIVFCNTKDETERVAEALQNKGFDADWLNGDLEQRDRERVMARTREGKLRFLVCTDVAARGIDISHLTHVINHDFPEGTEGYVHRTGRTGRAGRTGTAISIIGPKDIGNLYLLRLTYKIRPIEKQLPTEGEMKTRAQLDVVELFEDAFGGRVAHPDDLALARRLMTHFDAEKIVAGLLRDHLGARPGDPAQEASEARRAKNPPPVELPRAEVEAPREPAPPAPATRREGREREGRDERRPRSRGGMDGPRADAARPPRERREPDDASRPEPPPLPRAFEAPPLDMPPVEVPRVLEPPRADATRPQTRRAEPTRTRAPHKSFTTWEPPEDPDDDQPLIARGDEPRPDRAERAERERPERSERHETRQQPPERSEPRIDARPERHDTDVPPPPPPQADSDRDDPSFAQIFVNVGRRDGARAADIQKLLEETGGIPREETGGIRIRDRMTFVSVKKEVLEKAIAAFAGQVIGGRQVVAEVARARP